jgi:uncharacterized membrane protein
MPDESTTPAVPPHPPDAPRAYDSPGADVPPPPPPVGGYTPPRTSEDTVMLVLSYLSLLGLIPYMVSKNPEVRWHAKQGLTLTAIFLAATVAVWILAALPLIGWIAALARPLLSLLWMVLIVVGIAKALGGERWRMPVISDFTERW